MLLGDFADADKWFSEVVAETPNDAEAWYLLGRTKYNENRFAEAITSFERVLALRPKDIQAEDNLGLAQQGLGHTVLANAAFHTAIDWQGAAPTDAQPYLNLGTLLMDQGDPSAAVLHLEDAARLAPENPKIHEELDRAYVAKGDLEGAQMQLEEAVRLAPDAAALHFKLGQVYRRRGLNERAQQEFAECAKLNGGHSSTEVPESLLSAQFREALKHSPCRYILSRVRVRSMYIWMALWFEWNGGGMKILGVDIGGTNLKFRLQQQDEIIKVPSGPKMTPQVMMKAIQQHAAGWKYDHISVGFPGPVIHDSRCSNRTISARDGCASILRKPLAINP